MDGDTRETIRAVALELFSNKGFEQTSLREIAERVGLTKASLYYHYSSKQSLLLAVVEPVITGWRTIVDDTARLEHTPENVRHVVGRCLDVFLRNRSVAGIFQRDAAGVAVVLGELWDDMVGLGKRLVAWFAGPAPTTADRLRAVAAMEVLGAVLSSTTYQDEDEFTEEEMRAVLSQAAMDVLRLSAEPAASGVRRLG
ncbi:TetR/AcrR family transcriptional regulator [Actinophytocola glycyrrhizae]|uniref:TetR/AcrR family transcriptional regulator n=1 Tax=Actinophytocola glycyrrhizae TaxID=2044873 RepID=A0ABV9S6V4_9PSEU